MHGRLLTIIAWGNILATVAPIPIGAQLTSPRVVSSIDVSGTDVRYADSIRSAGVSVSPAFRLDWARATVGASASFTRLEYGGTNVQIALAPSVFMPNAGPFTAELAGSFGGSTHDDGARTGQMLGLGRLYLIGEQKGAWAGAGVGRTWDGVVWRNMRQGEIGAWADNGDLTAAAFVTPVIVEDTIRYTDIQAAFRYPFAALELGLTAGTRTGASGAVVGGTSRSWGNVSVVAWVSAQIAVVGNAGTYPVDLTQGYPGGRFVSLAVRLASRNTRASERRASSARRDANIAAESEPVAGATTFDVRTPRRGSSQRELRVYAPSARVVEINGDFTKWQPAPLTRGADGWWSMTRDIPAGTYQMNLRIDRGAWIAPPGLLTTRDEFGGMIGILTVE